MDFKLNYWSLYWYHLHYLSLKFPENPTLDEKQEVINLINKMSENGIPCSVCRDHFKDFVSKNDIDLIVSTKKNLIIFFMECHNEVNKMGNKEIFSYDQTNEYYSKDIVKGCKKYKWEDILSVEQDGYRYTLITKLFRNQELNSFPELFNKTFDYEFKRISNLIDNNEGDHFVGKVNKKVCNNCKKKKKLINTINTIKNKMGKIFSSYKYF